MRRKGGNKNSRAVKRPEIGVSLRLNWYLGVFIGPGPDRLDRRSKTCHFLDQGPDRTGPTPDRTGPTPDRSSDNSHQKRNPAPAYWSN